LVNVIKIVDLAPEASVQRELILIKVRADQSSRTAVQQVVALCRAPAVDVVPDAVTIAATGSEARLPALLTALDASGSPETVQTGAVAIGRGSKSMTDRALDRLARSA